MAGSRTEEGRGARSLVLEPILPAAGKTNRAEPHAAGLERVPAKRPILRTLLRLADGFFVNAPVHLDGGHGKRRDGESDWSFAPAADALQPGETAAEEPASLIWHERREPMDRAPVQGGRTALQHRVLSWVSANLFDHVTYTVRNGLNEGLRRKGGLGWFPMERDTPEARFWKSLDLRGRVVYDIGAFQGLLTIHYARDAREVVAWEPNSRNRRRLIENLSLNGFSNVIVRPYGLASIAARAEMSFDPLMSGMASLDSGVACGGEHETVELRTLDEEEGLEPPDLIKIDVEGFELEVLRGAARTLERGPDLFLEMHGADAADKRRRVQAITEHVWARGYRQILHVETQTQITPQNAVEAARGHLYARHD